MKKSRKVIMENSFEDNPESNSEKDFSSYESLPEKPTYESVPEGKKVDKRFKKYGLRKPQMNMKERNNKTNLTRKQRALKAMDLIVKSKPINEVVTKLGYACQEHMYKDLKVTLDKLEFEKVHEYRNFENLRLETLYKAIEDKALAGSTDHIKVALQISKQRSELLGLNAPQQIDINQIGQSNEVFLLNLGGKPLDIVENVIEGDYEVLHEVEPDKEIE